MEMFSPRHLFSPLLRSVSRNGSRRATETTAANNPSSINMASLDKLPPEIIYSILHQLSPRHIVPLTQVCIRLRGLALWQLSSIFDMRLGTPELFEDDHETWKETKTKGSRKGEDETDQAEDHSEHSRKRTYEEHARRIRLSRPGIHQNDSSRKKNETLNTEGPMSDFELYTRMLLAEFYEHEKPSPALTDGKEFVGRVLVTAKALLRRLYLSDSVNDGYLDEVEELERYRLRHSDDESMLQHVDNCVDHVDALGFRLAVLPTNSSLSSSLSQPENPPPIPLLNPYVVSKINMHVLARVIADQVCRGLCLPETAVLILQCLTSLRDQDHFHYLVNVPERNASLRVPVHEDRISIGQLCFQYLVPNVMTLLKPSSYSQPTCLPPSCSSLTADLLLPNASPKYNRPQMDHTKALTSQALLEQQELMQPFPSPACSVTPVVHQSRVLCFLPLLGRHFNTLPTSTFIETFLDQSKGDLPIDRAAVMVYGFMCVLDLETGKANLASDSYRIFERSMPTQGRVQAAEMIRIVERHRLLMRGFLLSSPTFSSSRVFRQNLSSQGVIA